MDMSLPVSTRQVQLKELSPKHKTVAALLAQGVDRVSCAAATDLDPNYITWLGGDPLFIMYVREMSKLAETRLEAMFTGSVDAIADQLQNGAGEDRLKAARLQMEATGRIGKDRRSPDSSDAPDHLEVLAQRLTKLLSQHREGVTLDGEAHVVQQE